METSEGQRLLKLPLALAVEQAFSKGMLDPELGARRSQIRQPGHISLGTP